MNAAVGWRGLSLVCPRCRCGLASSAGGAECGGCGTSYAERGGVLQLLATPAGVAAYPAEFFASHREVEERHFWFLGRRQVILDELRRAVPDLASRPLFDIGAGTGALLSFLAREGVPVAGACDAQPESLRLIRDRLAVPLVRVDEDRLPPLGGGHRLIGMFDVLEHLDDEAGVLAALREALVPGGFLALTVPAGPWLFDRIDELAGHRRRYTRDGLRRSLEQAGFEVRALRHFMAVTLPLLIVSRRLGAWLSLPVQQRGRAELRVVPGLNGVVRAALALERGVSRAVALPFGSSLVAIAARPAD